MVMQNQCQQITAQWQQVVTTTDNEEQSTMETVTQWQQHHQVETHCKHGNTGPMATVSQLNGGKFLQLRP